MKILISGFIGSENLGDEAILKAILANTKIDKHDVTAISLNEAKTRAVGVRTVWAKKPMNIVRAIKSCDVLLIGGGGLLQDQSSIFNFLYYMSQIYVAGRYKKPVILVFVGVGPIKHAVSRFLLERLAPKIDLAIVRDEESKRLLTQFSLDPQKIVAVHDAVLNLPYGNPPPSPFAADKPYVAVSLRQWFFARSLLPAFMTRRLNRLSFFSRRYEDFITKVAADLDDFLTRNTGLKLVFVSFYDSEDLDALTDVRQHMGHKGRVVFAKEALSEEEYLSIAKDSKFVIGMRLHSLVLASIVNKPFVALRYSTKVDEFAKQMHLSDYSIHVEHYDSRRLQKNLDAISADLPKLQKKMSEALERYQGENRGAFKLLQRRITEYKSFRGNE